MKPKSTLRSFLLLAGSTLLAISYTHAATLYWDGNDTTANADGGAGAWNAANAWDTAAIAGTNATWNSGTPDFAVFGGTASALVTTGAAITTSGIQFNTTGYTITADLALTPFPSAAPAPSSSTTSPPPPSPARSGEAGNVILDHDQPRHRRHAHAQRCSTGNGWCGTTTINAGTTLALASNASNAVTALQTDGRSPLTVATSQRTARRRECPGPDLKRSHHLQRRWHLDFHQGIGGSFTETIGAVDRGEWTGEFCPYQRLQRRWRKLPRLAALAAPPLALHSPSVTRTQPRQFQGHRRGRYHCGPDHRPMGHFRHLRQPLRRITPSTPAATAQSPPAAVRSPWLEKEDGVPPRTPSSSVRRRLSPITARQPH